MNDSSYERIYTVVSMIPKGCVATYGQVAEHAGLPRQARLVGYALNMLPKGTRIPWHRVINAQGKISLRSEDGADTTQKKRLQLEGVRFSASGVIEMGRYRWQT